jgi:hypothetical protein
MRGQEDDKVLPACSQGTGCTLQILVFVEWQRNAFSGSIAREVIIFRTLLFHLLCLKTATLTYFVAAVSPASQSPQLIHSCLCFRSG